MELFDAHTHLDLKQFVKDLEPVLELGRRTGIVGLVSSSMGPESFRRTQSIAQRHAGYVFHAAGYSASQVTASAAEDVAKLARESAESLVAIGEVGLDFHWVKDEAARKAQEPLFRQFIELANELGKPIVIHSRKAEEKAIDLLEPAFGGRVLMHCFDGSASAARRVSDNGWHITLPATFDKYRNRVQAARILPLEQIMLETDGPYLSPLPGRNEPANIIMGCRALANLLETDSEEVARRTTANARRFYGL